MELGVDDVAALLGGFTTRVRRRELDLNSLNVFPVADNDTGTNMVRTLQVIVAEVSAVTERASHTGVADAVARSALSGRGNSGLILGQFLAGFTSASDTDRLDVGEGLAVAATRARSAVARPVEGTMLTLADAVAAAAAVDPDPERLRVVAAEAVAATTGQLTVLAERGVVDSGAAGLALLFDALAELRAVGRDDVDDLFVCDVGLEPAPRPLGGVVVGHEIRFRLPAGVVETVDLRRLLSSIGTDVVVAATAEHLAAHLHVPDAHAAVMAISAELEVRLGASAVSYDVEPLVERDRV